MTLCAAVLAKQYRYKQPWVQQCQQTAVILYDGVPLCGTHINKLPEQVVVKPVFGFGTVKKIDG